VPTLSTVVLARWAAPGLRVCNDYTELTRGSPHRRSDHGLWPGRVSGLLSSRRAARGGAPSAPLQRRPRRAARRCPHFFVYPSFGHTRCLGSLPGLAAALDGVAADDAARYASQNCSHRGRWAHRLMSLAHAQGCPAPRAGGHIWALETASVPDLIGLPSARCTVGRQVPGAHLPSPGLTICGLAIQVLSRPLGLSLEPGDGYQLASCRSLDQLDWARSRALRLPWLRAELLTGRRSCLAAARAELCMDFPI
jgi:hypothetical protein